MMGATVGAFCRWACTFPAQVIGMEQHLQSQTAYLPLLLGVWSKNLHEWRNIQKKAIAQ